jgi:Matrixin
VIPARVLVFAVLSLPVWAFASEASESNWTGRYSPCDRHPDLLNQGHVDLGVRFSISNVLLAQQFAKAMDFWSGVLDIEWHEVDSQDCAIQVVDGTPSLFNFCTCLSARSQFPDRPEFQGWIAFNSRLKLSKHQMFLDSVHEIGHLLGLSHNPNESSVMFYFGIDKAVWLDGTDLSTLALHHRLRPGISYQKDGIREIRVAAPKPSGGRRFEAAAWWMRPLLKQNHTRAE